MALVMLTPSCSPGVSPVTYFSVTPVTPSMPGMKLSTPDMRLMLASSPLKPSRNL